MNKVFVFVLIVLLSQGSCFGATIYSNGFESGFGDVSKQYECEANKSHAFQLVTNPVHSGKYAIRINSLGEASDKCPEWGGTPLKHRLQLQLGINNSYPSYPSGLRLKANDAGPWTLSFWMYVPASLPSKMFIIWDIKSASTNFGESTAFMHLDKLDVRLQGNTPNEPKFSVPRDQWVFIKWYLVRSKDPTRGKMKFWMNDKLLLDQTGPTIPADHPDVESWFRIGIYYGLEDRPGQVYTLYFDDITIERGGVAPNVPKLIIK